MAYTPTPPTVDPSQKGPVLSGANDVPYVGKPKPGAPLPMPPGGTNRPPQKPRYGSSDGSGFDFQAYLAGKHRPRPVQVLPGQGMGPMPVGTKPLPNPVVKDTRGGGFNLEDWVKSHPNGPIYDEGPWMRGRGGQPTLDTGDNRLYRDPSTDPRNPEFRDFRDIGMRPPGFDGRGVDAGFSGETTTSLWNPPDRNLGESPNDYYARTRAGGGMQDMKGGMGQGGQQYGSPVAVGGAKPQYQGVGGPSSTIGQNAGGPPQVGTGPGSMGKPQQPGGMPSREGGASHRGQRPTQPSVNPQALQQGAQALYGDNTIPHEFKGQLLQAAQSGDAQAFNDMLFNSGIPHETKLRLQQMFGYGGGAPTQAATPDQGMQQSGPPGGFDPRMGSGYYGAF